MTDATDIYGAAKLVIDRHGEDASLYAAARTAVLAVSRATTSAPPSGDRSLRRWRSCSRSDGRERW
jgi:hypothetical protein